jgi:hypothetical protein
VPLQRTPGTAVLVLLTVTEPQADAVRRGSEAARDGQMPLEIVVLAPEGTSSRACLATMDDAVQLARSIAPQLEIKAETSGLDRHLPDTGRSHRAHPLVVTGPLTWDVFVEQGDLRWLQAGRVEVV